jgi:hypothetical protein
MKLSVNLSLTMLAMSRIVKEAKSKMKVKNKIWLRIFQLDGTGSFIGTGTSFSSEVSSIYSSTFSIFYF